MTTAVASQPTLTPAGSAQNTMLLVVGASTRSRCERCKGHGGYVPMLWLSNGSAYCGNPQICGDCSGQGYR